MHLAKSRVPAVSTLEGVGVVRCSGSALNNPKICIVHHFGTEQQKHFVLRRTRAQCNLAELYCALVRRRTIVEMPRTARGSAGSSPSTGPR